MNKTEILRRCSLIYYKCIKVGNTNLPVRQAGTRLDAGLDFSGIRGHKRQEYFTAVQGSASRDYEPMKRIFSGVLSRTRRTLG